MRINKELLEQIVSTDDAKKMVKLLHQPIANGINPEAKCGVALEAGGHRVITVQGFVNHVLDTLTGHHVAVKLGRYGEPTDPYLYDNRRKVSSNNTTTTAIDWDEVERVKAGARKCREESARVMDEARRSAEEFAKVARAVADAIKKTADSQGGDTDES